MKRFLLVCAVGTLASLTAFASDMCTNSGIIYSDALLTFGGLLDTSSTSCTVDGFTFSNFDVLGGTGFATGDTFSIGAIVDTPMPGAIQFTYSEDNATGSPITVGDFLFTYTLTPGTSTMVLLDGTAGTITENVCSSVVGTYGDSSTCNGTPLNNMALVTSSGGPTVAYSTVTYNSSDVVVKDVAGGSEFAQSVVPEPMTMSLLGIGLLGLGIVGRKQLRRR